jgi:hypothetical protein
VLAGCAPDTSAQINTPAPKAGTPLPDGQINVPGISIEVPGISLQINAPGPNSLVNQADTRGHVAGILLGIWHGIISPVTLVISFVNSSVQMYEVHNDGSPYNLGFMLGVAIIFLFLGMFAGSRPRRR